MPSSGKHALKCFLDKGSCRHLVLVPPEKTSKTFKAVYVKAIRTDYLDTNPEYVEPSGDGVL